MAERLWRVTQDLYLTRLKDEQHSRGETRVGSNPSMWIIPYHPTTGYETNISNSSSHKSNILLALFWCIWISLQSVNRRLLRARK